MSSRVWSDSVLYEMLRKRAMIEKINPSLTRLKVILPESAAPKPMVKKAMAANEMRANLKKKSIPSMVYSCPILNSFSKR